MTDVQGTGETVEPEFDTSPDVNIDGSVEETQSSVPESETTGGVGSGRRLLYRIRGTLIAPFKLLREWVVPMLALLIVLGSVGALFLFVI